MAAPEGAAALIGLLNKVIKVAVTAGVGASIVQNSLFALNARAPALIIQGGADDIVRPEVTTQFVRGACRAGASVQYVTLPGKGHGGAMDAGRRQAVTWLAQRLSGQPARSNCR